MFALTGRHQGFSLVELVAIVGIVGLAAGAIISTLTRQQQFYRGVAELRSARGEVRDAIEVLAADIRGMSAGDAALRADSALELFAAIGGSVVCRVLGSEIGLPPSHSSGNTISDFLVDPDTGDIAMLYVDSAALGRRWRQYRITGFESRSASSACGQSSRFTSVADFDASNGYALTITAPIPDSVVAGTPVRFLRRARYSLYRAADGNSYLGYRRCNAVGRSECGSIQPVSGPYLAYSSDPRTTGLLFEYFDGSGARLDASAAAWTLARIDITVRSASQQRNSFSQRRAKISDSTTISVALRNRGPG